MCDNDISLLSVQVIGFSSINMVQFEGTCMKKYPAEF